MSNRIIFVFDTAAAHTAWRAAAIAGGASPSAMSHDRFNSVGIEYDSARRAIGPREAVVPAAAIDAAGTVEGVTMIGPDGWENWMSTVNWVEPPAT